VEVREGEYISIYDTGGPTNGMEKTKQVCDFCGTAAHKDTTDELDSEQTCASDSGKHFWRPPEWDRRGRF
jgi:hypothetical protein